MQCWVLNPVRLQGSPPCCPPQSLPQLWSVGSASVACYSVGSPENLEAIGSTEGPTTTVKEDGQQSHGGAVKTFAKHVNWLNIVLSCLSGKNWHIGWSQANWSQLERRGLPDFQRGASCTRKTLRLFGIRWKEGAAASRLIEFWLLLTEGVDRTPWANATLPRHQGQSHHGGGLAAQRAACSAAAVAVIGAPSKGRLTPG